MKLEDRVAIVPGGGRGLGRAIARGLAGDGALGVVADVDASGAARGAAELPGGVAVHADVSTGDGRRRTVEMAVERFGRLDVLVDNSALIPWAPIDEIDPAERRRILAANLDGVFLASEEARWITGQTIVADAGLARH